MPLKTFVFNQGLNTSADRSMLAPGELQLATGAYYKPGDTTRLWKLLGRSNWGTLASASRINTVALFKYDTAASDKLIVLSADGSLHTGALTTATTGSFTTLTTGLDTSGDMLSWVHYDDVWYLGNAINPNYALESDGTFRRMGMQANPGLLSTEDKSAGTLTERATTVAGTDWNYQSRILSANYTPDNYTYDTPEPYVSEKLDFTVSDFAADTGSGRYIIIRTNTGPISPGDPFTVKTDSADVYDVTLKVEVDEGSGFTTAYTQEIKKPVATGNITIPVTDGIDLANVEIRFSIQQTAGIFINQGTTRVFDIRITDAGNTGDFTPEFGYYYAVAEYDSARDLEAPFVASGPTRALAAVEGNAVELTFPPDVQNPLADIWRIYRTHDGGNVPDDLRLYDTAPIDAATYLDVFESGQNGIGNETPPQLKVQITESLAQYYKSNMPPKAMTKMVEYQNFLVGLTKTDPRALFYSLPAAPEYWPEIYTITDFPLQEHDTLKSMAVAGDLLVVGAAEAIIVINGLPEVESQAYANAYMTALKGAPGCVGPLAMTAYSLGGEPRVAWLSKFGLYETNGHQVWELTHDIDFGDYASADLSKAAVYWDSEEQLLYCMYDSNDDTYNDRFFTLHMSPEHRKGQGGNPKVTGPHYGQLTNIVGGAITADNEYHMYGADSAATGQVVNEKVGGVDATNAYSTASELPFDVKSARLYSEQLVEWAVDFPTIRHTDWSGQVALTWTVGRDDVGESSSVVNTITMDSQKSTKFVVARAGEWHELRMVHTGVALTGAMIHIQAQVQPMAETGDTQAS